VVVSNFFDGACEGRIAKAPAGAEGFGYDPVFVPEGHSESFAELGESIKSKLSHRALAVLAMRRCLES
jgi:XTP/dITP diphosphohydrolase